MKTPDKVITPAPIKYHSDFDDPSDNLVFLSNDGAYFRASSHKLAKVSSTFADMMAAPTGDSEAKSTDKAIELDFDASVVTAFLQSTYRARDSSHNMFSFVKPETRYRRMLSLFSLLDYFECPKLYADYRFKGAQAAKSVGKSFDLFVMASERNDPELADKALNNIQADELSPICQTVETLDEHLGRVPLTWASHVREKVLINIDGHVLFRYHPRYRRSGPWFSVNFQFPPIIRQPSNKRKRSPSPSSTC